MPRRASLGTWLYLSCTALVFMFMSLRASTGRRARPSRPSRSAPAPHPGDAVLATVPSHARLADSLTPPSPPVSHLRPPSPLLPRSTTASRGKRHAALAPSSMLARFVASSKPIAAGGAGAGAAAAAVEAATGKPAASSPPPPPSPPAPQPLQTPPTVPPCPVSSPHDVPRGQLRDIPHGQFRHRDTTTASHGPHARRRPLLVTGPRTAPRWQLHHATRDCPLQSQHATVTPHSMRPDWPQSGPSPPSSKLKKKTSSRASQGQVPRSTLSFLSRFGRMQHTSSFPALLKHRIPISSHLNEKKKSFYMVGPHQCPAYGHRAKTLVRIRCRLTLLTMPDSPYGDVRLSRTSSLRGHPAFSQVLPQRALARKRTKKGARMHMLDSTLS